MKTLVVVMLLCATLTGCGAVALGILAGQHMQKEQAKPEKVVYVYPDGQKVEVTK